MAKVLVFYIYADNCKHCESALTILEGAIKKCKNIPCEIRKLIYNSNEAITLAVNKNISDLPGIVIGNEVFVKECTEKQIIDAINK